MGTFCNQCGNDHRSSANSWMFTSFILTIAVISAVTVHASSQRLSVETIALRREVSTVPAPVISGGQASISPSPTWNARDIYSLCSPSVVSLEVTGSDMHTYIGTGFFIEPGLIATNFHVVANSLFCAAHFKGDERVAKITGVVAIDQEHDLAILAVDDASSPALALDSDTTVAPGDHIFVFGTPQGLDATLSDGIVSALRNSPRFETETGRRIQMSAPISPGDSGAPVLNDQGSVVAICQSICREGQNLNFAVPCSYLKQLLQAKGELKPLAVATATYAPPGDTVPPVETAPQIATGPTLRWIAPMMDYEVPEVSAPQLRERIGESESGLSVGESGVSADEDSGEE